MTPEQQEALDYWLTTPPEEFYRENEDDYDDFER